jgi:hypothetical protein
MVSLRAGCAGGFELFGGGCGGFLFFFQLDVDDLALQLALQVVAHHTRLGQKLRHLAHDLRQPFGAEDHQGQ